MKLARVVGNLVSTAKDRPLEGKKILVLQPVNRNGDARGKLLIGLDAVGAGVGEYVFYVRGKEGSFPWYPTDTPSDCSIVGILDPSNFENKT